ncbi:hypothetical protein KC906_04185 [Candidatus Kaiserbacteria bacterium]|nr:hypothetical protein [Candidatus Kaiserbacteria bacterium]
MENNTAKNFVLQLGSLISLYLSLSFLLVILFGLINVQFPDAAEALWEIETASDMIRVGFAMVIVFFPTYLILTRLVNQTRRSQPDGSYLGLTKWLIYLSLLVGGAVLLGDLVAVIMAFLDGEITTRFILKALAVLLVIGAAVSYYILDAKGHWITHEKKSVRYGIGAVIVVVLSLVAGLLSIDSPAETRELKLDQIQITDLQNIQWQIQDNLTLNGSLPESLDDVSAIKLPEAPEGRPAYEYHFTESGFEICATFASDSSTQNGYYPRSMAVVQGEIPTIINPDNWEYKAGEWCFERVVASPDEKSDI